MQSMASRESMMVVAGSQSRRTRVMVRCHALDLVVPMCSTAIVYPGEELNDDCLLALRARQQCVAHRDE